MFSLEDFFGEEAVSVVIMILVFGIIIAFITGGDKNKEGAFQRMGINFKELFGGKGGH